MARIRSDLKFGTITDNPLAVGGTSVNSAQFSTLPTVAGSDELWITLDPEGSNREIVKVTAHSAAATVCTIARGQLGTSAAQHALGVRWAHGIVTTDLTVPCTSSTRPTLGLWAGMSIIETDTNRELTYTGSGWVRTGWLTSAGRTGLQISRAAAQTINNASTTDVSFDTETFDSDGFFAPTSTTVTVPAGLGGLYHITASVELSASTAGAMGVVILINAAQYPVGGVGTFARQLASGTFPLNAGDTVKVQGYQASGSALTMQANLFMYRMGA